MSALENKSVLLIISGGIAAYKSLELIRLIKKDGGKVRCILTDGGAHFVTPLSVAALSNEPVYTDLWSLKDESEMGHIRLSREADLIVVAPASADIIAKMAAGMANDLATTTLLAADKPVLIAPAMNQMMWGHAATQDNIRTLQKRGILQVGPAPGDMACGETGMGRMSEAEDILAAIMDFFSKGQELAGREGAGHQRPDLRADRPGALPFQPLVRQAGTCGRRSPARARGARSRLSPGRSRWPIRRGLRPFMWKPPPRCWRPARELYLWISL